MMVAVLCWCRRCPFIWQQRIPQCGSLCPDLLPLTGASCDLVQVLLSLGVSYTNELDQAQALNYLHRWLSQHPTHSPAASAVPDPGDTSQRLAWVMRSFEEAAATAPADGDLQVSKVGCEIENVLGDAKPASVRHWDVSCQVLCAPGLAGSDSAACGRMG